MPALVGAFQQHCDEQKWRLAYLSTSEPFATWAIQNGCGAILRYGNQLTVNAQDDPRAKTGVNASLVAAKVDMQIKRAH